MSARADVVIVGGGVAGCSIAYSLACRGIKPLLIERDRVAGQASGVAAGLLTPLAEAKTPGFLLSLGLAGLKWHQRLAPRLKEETGLDVGHARLPVLRVAFDAEEERTLLDQISWQKEALDPSGALSVSWVRSEDLARLEPAVSRSARGAACSSGEARVDSGSLVEALAQAAMRRGARLIQTAVRALARKASKITGLILEDGSTVSGNTYVFALGAWSAHVGGWLDFPIPVRPLRGQILQLKSPGNRLKGALFHGSNYVLPRSDGTLLAGTTMEWAGFENQMTAEGTASIRQIVKTLAPDLADCEIVASRSGLRPISDDGLPIVGAVPHWDNAFVASGYGRKGILLGPLLGECAADSVLARPGPLSIEPLKPDRLLARISP